MNKILVFIFLLFLFACKVKSPNKNEYQSFLKNGYNIELNKARSYKNIKFKLSESFEKNLACNFTVVPSTSKCYFSSIYNTYFSIEKFTENDRNRPFLFEVSLTKDFHNLVQDAYVFRRLKSLTNSSASIKKECSKNVKYPSLIQVISGDESYGKEVYYTVSTLKINNDYFVFQWITNEETMGFVYDDFERILNSVRKIK